MRKTAKPKTVTIAKGITRGPNGRYRVTVWAIGRLHVKRYPPDAQVDRMQLWQAERRVKERIDATTAAVLKAAGPVFDDDAKAYLDAVTSMPSYSDQARLIESWRGVFTLRRRDTITPLEIRTQLEKWLTAGYAPSSVNKRRTALQSFYSRLNGKSGYNPVRDVERYEEGQEPRAQAFWTIYRILAMMPESKTRARLRVILWTGWPHKQLKQLRPEHLNLTKGRAYVTPRRKGKGRKGVWLPLLPGAVVALREFDRLDCYTPTIKGKPRPFSNSAMHSSFVLALEKLNARRAKHRRKALQIRPYDLRHTFGTMLAERVKDDRAIQSLLMHSTAAQTRRYTEAATEARVRAAVNQIAAG